MTTTLKLSEIQKNYSKVLRSIERTGERIIVTRRGRPAAALVPIEDYELILKLKGRIR